MVEDLRSAGIETWHDQTLTGGQRWWDNILAKIRECDIFIFALSIESWESEACRSELSYLEKLGKPILPVLVSDDYNINLLPPPLNEIQVTDYRRRDKDASFALIKSINMVPPAMPLPDPLPEPPPVPMSYLIPLQERIDTSEMMSSHEQNNLIFEMEERIQNGRSLGEIRELLLRMKRRDDLLAKASTKIDAALKSIEDKIDHLRENVLTGDTKQIEQDLINQIHHSNEPIVCPQCHNQIAISSRFCGNCGATIKVSEGINAPSLNNPNERTVTNTKSKIQHYICSPANAHQLIADVKGWLDSQEFDSQQMVTDNQGVLLQIKKRGNWRDYVGMSTSLNIVFHQSGDTLSVEIGAGKWIDKAAAGTISMFVLWPLAITAGIGAWEQAKMPEKVFTYLGSRLAYKKK
jgi:hypothetical protein